MSVQDIIYITCEEFKTCGNNIECLDKYKDIYSKLLSDYDCFSKPDIVASRFSSNTIKGSESGYFKNQYDRSKHDSKKQHGYGYSKHSIPKKRPTDFVAIQRPIRLMMSSEEQSLISKTKRVMKGLLNIINKENYHKISRKVLAEVNEENVGCIVSCVLENACLQVFYLPIFANLLDDIINGYAQYNAIIVDTINEFIDSFICKKEFIYDESNLESLETKYLRFCKQQKHKSIASSRCIVVVHLLSKGFSKIWNLQTYCTHVTDLLSDYKSSEFNTDILITMVKYIKQKNKKIHIDLAALSCITEGNDNQRWKFMIEELCQ